MFRFSRESKNIRPLPQPTPETLAASTIVGRFHRDPADRLPPGARKKLKKLRSEVADADALTRTVYDKLKENRELIGRVEGRIYDLQRGSTSPTPDVQKLIDAERATIGQLRDEIALLDASHVERKARASAARVVVQAAEEYIATKSGLSDAPPIAPKLGKVETPAQAVERLRAGIDDLRADMQSALDAPIHSSAAKAVARRHIEALANSGRPNVLVTIEGRHPPKFVTRIEPPEYALTSDGGRTVGAARDGLDIEATLAWLFKDQLVASLERAIDEDADDASALSDKDRAERIAAAKKEILICEREEERLIEIVHSSGTSIARRADADPRAVLGLADTAPEPRA